MGDTVRDERRRHWFHIDNVVVDEYLPIIGDTAFAVYACLVRDATDGVSALSYTDLQRRLGTGRSQISAAIKAIVDVGLVTVAVGKRRQNLYQLVTPTSPDPGLVPNRNQSRSGTGTSPESEPVAAELVPNRNQSPGSSPPRPLSLPVPKVLNQDNSPVGGEGEDGRLIPQCARAPTREPDAGDAIFVPIPSDLSPGDEERAQMEALSIPKQWYMAKWWSLVEHYEGKPLDTRSLETWRRTCRRLISEDWAKHLAGQASRPP